MNSVSYEGPFWRSNGSILASNQLVDELFHYMSKWVLNKEGKLTREQKIETWNIDIQENEELNNYLLKIPAPSYSSRSKNTCDLIMLMCAIHLEDQVNQFLVFNINESIVNAIDRMSSVQKLEIALAVLNQENFKGTHIHQKLKDVMDWRNKYAHGKLDDMPKQETLRKTHLEHMPDQYPNLQDYVKKLIEIINNTYDVAEYLISISTHEYTSLRSSELIQLHGHNKMIKKFYEKYIINVESIDDLY